MSQAPKEPYSVEGIHADNEKRASTHTESNDNPTHKDADSQHITGLKLGLVIVSLVLACFLLLLDTSVISTAIPKITDEFHSLADVGWYGSAYTLGSAALQPLTGKVYHNFSLKWSFLAFFALFELGSVLCGAAKSSAMLIGGRVVAGVGGSGLLNGAITIISASVPFERRPALIGMMMGISQLGTVAGPLIGGAFTTAVTWRWSFYINLPLGALVAIPVILIHIPEQRTKDKASRVLPHLHRHLDLVGFALFAPAVVQLLLALQYGGVHFPWNSSQVIGLFVGAGATFIVWCIWNYHKGDDALIPVSIVKKQVVWTSAINYALVLSTLFGTSYFLPIYFQAVKGVNAILSGVYLLPTILSQLVFAIASGVLVTKIGFVPPFALVSAALTAIGTGLFSLFQPHTSTGMWVGYQILAGAGRGMGLQMPIVAVQSSTETKDLSTSTAVLVFAQYIGPTIFLTLYNTIFSSSLTPQLHTHAPNANAQAIINAGATRFRNIVDPSDLPGVLIAYSNSIDRVYYLVAAVGAVAFVAAFGMGWKDIRKKDDKTSQGQPPLAEP
ncbi:major facilitator superfamily domain-containing protein [Xylaria scruposa]|nr:major facilitator superfamily domain-containing protein [Xylaria scruposa]